MGDTSQLLLRHYHCTFFLPLFDLEESGFRPRRNLRHRYRPGEAATPSQQAEAQAWLYFTPVLRDILFDLDDTGRADASLEPLQEWRLPEDTIKSWTLELGQDEARDDPARYQVARVESVTLYRYFNGIYLLAWRVAPQALRCSESLPQGQDPEAALKIENWLHFTRLARVLFPSYPQQEDEGKIQPLRLLDGGNVIASAFDKPLDINFPAVPGEILSPVVKELLSCFAAREGLLDGYWPRLRAIHDDRLFVSVVYGLQSSAVNVADLRKLYSLAFHGDRHADGFDALGGHAYTPEELHRRLDHQTLWLWKGAGQYYGFSDSTNVYLGNGDFFCNAVARNHVPHIYDRMLIQALFYQATLRQYNAQLAEDTPKILNAAATSDMEMRRKAFIRFTNGYWFHDLTEQMQGKEIFRLQQQALALERDYGIIRDKLERTDEFLRLMEGKRWERFSRRLNLWAGIIAIVGVWYTILGLGRDWWQDTGHKETLWRWFGRWPESFSFPNDGEGFFVAVVAIPMVLALLWWGWVRHRR